MHLGEPFGGGGDRPAQRFSVRWVAVPFRAPGVEPAAAGLAVCGCSFTSFAQPEIHWLSGEVDHSTQSISMGSRSLLILSLNLPSVCAYVLFIVKNHSAPVSFYSLLNSLFFLYRAFSMRLSEIVSDRACCAGRGRSKSELVEETLLSASGPPREEDWKKQWVDYAHFAAHRPGSERTGVPGRCQLGPVCGRAVESGARRVGFAPVCAAGGHCASSRPSIARSDLT